MARKKAKTKNVRREAFGILMQAVWILLLLALASYDAKDTPDWSHSAENTINYIGPVGASVAFVIFRVFGLVGFLLPLMIAGWGLMLILSSDERIWPRVLWMLGILTGLCILADIQLPFWNNISPQRFNVNDMPGGFLGLFLGRLVLVNYLGKVGAAIISTGLVATGLFFALQVHPVEVWRGWLALWHTGLEKIEERAALKRTAQEQAEREARLLAKERAKLEREMERERKAAERERDAAEREERRRQREREAEEEAQREREEEERRRQAEAERKAAFRKRLAEQQKAEAEKKAAEEQAARQAREAAEEQVSPGTGAEADGAQPKWTLPPMTYLQEIPEGAMARAGGDELDGTIQTIRQTLAEFGIEAEVTHVEQGPVVTRYELLPAAGVKVERIGNLQANITLALKAESVRVQAPIPGKGVVGIEVPNRKPAPVVLRQLIESATWATSKAYLPLALGQDVGGHVLMADLASLPHMLIAGATGQGKTVCMNSILAGLLMTRTPEELRLILIDPKIVEFSGYNDLPHLLVPVITDAKKVTMGLRWAIQEMERRFKLFHRAKVRDIVSFNRRPKAEQPSLFHTEAQAGEEGGTPAPVPVAVENPAEDALPDHLPYVVIIIDELADLMLSAQQEIEPQVQKLTQLARATGIHMIIATQRPTVDIVTGTIKSNIPGRVAFKVAQKNDSRVVIDQEGADKLVGKGDMLVLTGANKLTRAQGAWTKDEEIQAIAEHWKQQGRPRFESALQSKMEGKGGVDLPDAPEEDEEIIQQAIEVIRQTRRASTSSIQRRLRIGYTRAARLMDILEEKGMIGPPRGAEAREILFDLDGFDSMDGAGPGDDEFRE
ncbi:MAG: DNA translocase FtsK [Verrucomicrobiota bacterium]|nr:DNA translocase FtsK [Verrucomicrobiota bacterium]